MTEADIKCSALESRLARLEAIFERLDSILTMDVPHESAAMVSRIQSLVAHIYGVDLSGMLGPARTDNYLWPRYIAIRLCRDLTGLSLQSIAYHFGGRDHTTIVYALKSLQNRLDTDAPFARNYSRIRQKAEQLVKSLERA